MTEKELNFLDYLLPKLSDAYPNRLSASCINDKYKEETGIDIDYREINILVDKYDGEYFEKTTPMRHVRITSEWDERIKIFGSLSHFLKRINEKNKEENNSTINESSITIENLILGDNNGIQSSDGDFNNPIIKNTNVTQSNNKVRKSLFIRIIKSPLTILILGLIVTAILNADRIVSWINDIINNI